MRCHECSGTGRVYTDDATCITCNGTGIEPLQPSPRGTEAPLAIAIRFIPHRLQRYDTCGDYYQMEDTLCVQVSELNDRREMLLVAIHELCEWALCQAKG